MSFQKILWKITAVANHGPLIIIARNIIKVMIQVILVVIDMSINQV